MIKRFCSRWIIAGTVSLVSCEAPTGTGTNPPPPPPPPPGVVACTTMVTLNVSSGTIPTFSWTPDCLVGRLIVEEGIEEKWGTETGGTNIYRSPITYDDPDIPGSTKYEPGAPLVPGHTYVVSVYKWISVLPESLELVGSESFSP